MFKTVMEVEQTLPILNSFSETSGICSKRGPVFGASRTDGNTSPEIIKTWTVLGRWQHNFTKMSTIKPGKVVDDTKTAEPKPSPFIPRGKV